MIKLQFVEDPSRYMKLTALPVTLGRDASNNFAIDDARISDFHAEINGEDGELYIVDLLSATGTFVNEQRIVEATRLRSWDMIRIGTVQLEINDPNACRPGSWALRTESDLLSSQFYTLQTRTIVGRDADCDLTIDWYLLSRRHAELCIEDGHLKVTDLNSSNGTYINGSRVEQGIARPGDEVRFDEQRFIVVGPTRTERDFDAYDDRTILREDSAELTQLAASPADESLDSVALSRPSPAEKPAEPPQSASCEPVPEAGDTDCDSVSKGGEGQAEAEYPARLAVQGEKGDATDGGPEFAKPVEIANDALTQVMIRSRDEEETVLFKRSEADVETRLFQRTDVPPPEAPIKRESTPESSPKAGWLAGLLVFLLFSALAGAIFFWRTTQ